MLLIKNGRVKTMAGPDIENGQVLIDGRKIAAVGTNLEVPAGTEVIDAAGALVTPGLIDGHCHIGMHEEVIGRNGDDVNEDVNPLTPQLRAIDAINPRDEAFAEAYSHGITCAVTGPGSANVIGGTFVAMKTCGIRMDKMIVKSPVAMKVAFGENPKRVYGGEKKSPCTRMATAAILRDALHRAREYNDAWTAYEADPRRVSKPEFDLGMDAMRPVMRKEIPLKAHAHRADDIFTVLRIVKEFDVDVTLDHCTEGALIVDELVKEGRPALIGPTLCNKTKPEVSNRTFRTAGILADAGILTAIITDAPVIPLEYLPLCAGLSIKAGMKEEDAWKAVTINPAKITGIADRVGSLEPGKDADVVIFRGNPLKDICCETLMTIIDGKIVYQAE